MTTILQDNKNEMLPLVDEEGNIILKKTEIVTVRMTPKIKAQLQQRAQ